MSSRAVATSAQMTPSLNSPGTARTTGNRVGIGRSDHAVGERVNRVARIVDRIVDNRPGSE